MLDCYLQMQLHLLIDKLAAEFKLPHQILLLLLNFLIDKSF